MLILSIGGSGYVLLSLFFVIDIYFICANVQFSNVTLQFIKTANTMGSPE